GPTLQKRFLGHFLKGEDPGWDQQPKVALNIRRPGENFTWRAENEWPLARTQWTRFYLAPDGSLAREPPQGEAIISYATTGDGLTFSAPAVSEEVEITGPVAAKLFVSSDRRDADLFLVLQLF